MKWLMLLMVCLVLNTATVNASEYDNVPNVVGLEEEDAKQMLESYVLPNGEKVEVILKYEYHSETPEGKIISQEIQQPGQNTELAKVIICVSLGTEPNEYLGSLVENEVACASFGISDYVDWSNWDSRFGIDWTALPESYEYNWDNSSNCWQWGVWIDGKQYKTPKGKFDTNVRHKVQGYCDGTYVYLRLVMSRDYGDRVNGDDYQFWLDGNSTRFQLRTMDGHNLTNKFGDIKPGTHQVEIRHADHSISGEIVADSVAYVTKHSRKSNAVLELKVPLSEMARQNKKINLERLGVIEFYCPNLMYRRYRIAGASTFPFALAATALVAVPGSTVLIKKYKKKKVKIHD